MRIVAARLRHVLRANDLVGRIGEVEFACMLPDVADAQQTAPIVRRLLEAVAAPMRIGSIELGAQAHVGVAMSPADGQGADQLLCNAHAAMFRATRLRSGHAFYGRPISHRASLEPRGATAACGWSSQPRGAIATAPKGGGATFAKILCWHLGAQAHILR